MWNVIIQLYEMILHLCISYAYYIKLSSDVKNIDYFIKYNVKTSIKSHLIQSLKIGLDEDIYIFHTHGIFKNKNEIDFAKVVMTKQFMWSQWIFWLWYYSLKFLLNQSNILTTIIYIKDCEKMELVSIFVEYTTYSKVHYLVTALVDSENEIKELKSFKYVDLLINCLESGARIICLGEKTDILKLGIGAEKYNSHISIVKPDEEKCITMSDILLRILSTT